MLAAFPVGIAAAFSCEFIEFLTKTTINSAMDSGNLYAGSRAIYDS